MSLSILPIPDIPKGLREAAQIGGRLVPFIGAGASRLAGLPDWSKLANDVLDRLIARGKFSHAQGDQIKHLTPRIKLSIALGLQKRDEALIDFQKILQPSNWQRDPKGQRLYGSLSKLSSTFVTTNYDEWLDEEISDRVSIEGSGDPAAPETRRKRRVLYQIQDLIPANLKPNTVIHLHGSVLDPTNMIVTTQDYVRRYANDRWNGDAKSENRTLTFLGHLFESKTVLFIGYGLEELEILEYVILKARNVAVPNVEKHFLLQGFFSHEAELAESMGNYYRNECGIHLLPFLRDRNGWDQLLEVLDQYSRSLIASEPSKLQTRIEMERLARG